MDVNWETSLCTCFVQRFNIIIILLASCVHIFVASLCHAKYIAIAQFQILIWLFVCPLLRDNGFCVHSKTSWHLLLRRSWPLSRTELIIRAHSAGQRVSCLSINVVIRVCVYVVYILRQTRCTGPQDWAIMRKRTWLHSPKDLSCAYSPPRCNMAHKQYDPSSDHGSRDGRA